MNIPAGQLIEAHDLTLMCPTCGIKHTNIRNRLTPLPLEKAFPKYRSFLINHLHTDDICECLFQHFKEYVRATGHSPIIDLYPDPSSNN